MDRRRYRYVWHGLKRAIQAICISMGVDVLFGLFQHNEDVRSNVGTGCNVMAPLQGGGGICSLGKR